MAKSKEVRIARIQKATTPPPGHMKVIYAHERDGQLTISGAPVTEAEIQARYDNCILVTFVEVKNPYADEN